MKTGEYLSKTWTQYLQHIFYKKNPSMVQRKQNLIEMMLMSMIIKICGGEIVLRWLTPQTSM